MKSKNYALKIILIILVIINTKFFSTYSLQLNSSAVNNSPQILYNKSEPIENIDNRVFSRGGINDSINLYHEKMEAVQVFNSGSKKLYITSNDIELMSKVVYKESRGEPYEGKVAVASVILNRAVNPKFPGTIEGVIKEKNAFSCVVNGKINANPDESCYKAVMDAISGTDPTNNAIYFYNPKTATSAWMKNVNKLNSKSIGNHIFFNK
ncbi:cell wall hydrolase [Clostridium polynesiense]|uniref:cell wall hydrolase n=1 Tax=Clostridium polynesiense TaxID=1325933 RepID=UPI00058D2A25|nr:cell wall hydrolase [Clostridium polynesiense]